MTTAKRIVMIIILLMVIGISSGQDQIQKKATIWIDEGTQVGHIHAKDLVEEVDTFYNRMLPPNVNEPHFLLKLDYSGQWSLASDYPTAGRVKIDNCAGTQTKSYQVTATLVCDYLVMEEG